MAKTKKATVIDETTGDVLPEGVLSVTPIGGTDVQVILDDVSFDGQTFRVSDVADIPAVLEEIGQ